MENVFDIKDLQSLPIFADSAPINIILDNLSNGVQDDSIQINGANFQQFAEIQQLHQIIQNHLQNISVFDIFFWNCQIKQTLLKFIGYLDICIQYNLKICAFYQLFHLIDNEQFFLDCFGELKKLKSQSQRPQFLIELISPNNLQLFVKHSIFGQIDNISFQTHKKNKIEQNQTVISINFDYKMLFYFPETFIFQFDYLFNLDISGNNFNSLPNLKPLEKLVCLNLSKNNFINFENIVFPENVLQLNLSDCQLEKISGKNLPPKTEHLNLSENLFTTFLSVQIPKTTKTIIFDENPFECANKTQIVCDLSFLPNLSQVSFLDCGLKSTFNVKLNAKQIICANFMVNNDLFYNNQKEQFFENALKINYNYCNLSKVKGNHFSKQIQSLSIVCNDIQNIYHLRYYHQIIELNLESNLINSICDFPFPPQLQKLNLSENRIQNFKNSEHLKNLKTLLLNQNKITDVSDILQIKTLQELQINQNCIQKFTNTNFQHFFQQSFQKLNFLELDFSPKIDENWQNILQLAHHIRFFVQKYQLLQFYLFTNLFTNSFTKKLQQKTQITFVINGLADNQINEIQIFDNISNISNITQQSLELAVLQSQNCQNSQNSQNYQLFQQQNKINNFELAFLLQLFSFVNLQPIFMQFKLTFDDIYNLYLNQEIKTNQTNQNYLVLQQKYQQ